MSEENKSQEGINAGGEGSLYSNNNPSSSISQTSQGLSKGGFNSIGGDLPIGGPPKPSPKTTEVKEKIKKGHELYSKKDFTTAESYLLDAINTITSSSGEISEYDATTMSADSNLCLADISHKYFKEKGKKEDFEKAGSFYKVCMNIYMNAIARAFNREKLKFDATVDFNKNEEAAEKLINMIKNISLIRPEFLHPNLADYLRGYLKTLYNYGKFLGKTPDGESCLNLVLQIGENFNDVKIVDKVRSEQTKQTSTQ